MSTLREDLELMQAAEELGIDGVKPTVARDALARFDACKRAWRVVDGEKAWYRLVPDPEGEVEGDE